MRHQTGARTPILRARNAPSIDAAGRHDALGWTSRPDTPTAFDASMRSGLDVRTELRQDRQRIGVCFDQAPQHEIRRRTAREELEAAVRGTLTGERPTFDLQADLHEGLPQCRLLGSWHRTRHLGNSTPCRWQRSSVVKNCSGVFTHGNPSPQRSCVFRRARAGRCVSLTPASNPSGPNSRNEATASTHEIVPVRRSGGRTCAPLPAERSAACAFTPAESEARNPHDRQDDRGNPQQVDCKTCAEQNQYEECQQDYCHWSLPFVFLWCRASTRFMNVSCAAGWRNS